MKPLEITPIHNLTTSQPQNLKTQNPNHQNSKLKTHPTPERVAMRLIPAMASTSLRLYEPREICQEVLHAYETGEYRWIQQRGNDGTNGYCILGAVNAKIREILDLDDRPWTGDECWEYSSAFFETRRALTETVKGPLVSFNDAPSRTLAEIKDVLRKVGTEESNVAA